MKLNMPSKALVFLALVACGGALTPNLGGEDASSDSAGDPGGDGGGDGGSGDGRSLVDGRAGDTGSGNRCDSLVADVESLRPKVLECCLVCAQQQCSELVADLCCPISVSGNNPNLDAFTRAVQAVKDAGCHVACPARPCRGTPSFTCAMGSSVARCVP